MSVKVYIHGNVNEPTESHNEISSLHIYLHMLMQKYAYLCSYALMHEYIHIYLKVYTCVQ